MYFKTSFILIVLVIVNLASGGSFVSGALKKFSDRSRSQYQQSQTPDAGYPIQGVQPSSPQVSSPQNQNQWTPQYGPIHSSNDPQQRMSCPVCGTTYVRAS